MEISISDYDYDLPEERIAKFPLEERDASRLLISQGGRLSQARFRDIGDVLPQGALLVFNNTRVIRARLIMHKPTRSIDVCDSRSSHSSVPEFFDSASPASGTPASPSADSKLARSGARIDFGRKIQTTYGGARVEVFCLEPHAPVDYERAFAIRGGCEWKCMVGNSKKWKDGPLEIPFEYDGVGYRLLAHRVSKEDRIVRFEWDAPLAFGQLLEHLGRIPIPPYLGRDSEESDNNRYQTVYSRFDGSVAAPTAGLHFTPELIGRLRNGGVKTDEVTLHVGAGTFLPVKADDVTAHSMHTEHFEVTAALLENLIAHIGCTTAVGTTTVRTLESLAGLGYRVLRDGSPDEQRPVGQWELYDIPATVAGAELLQSLADYMHTHGLAKLSASTQIMIMPGYRFRVTDAIITNFHQPRSTLLLLISAFVGPRWRGIYDYALANGFRFLSYGDSSILTR